MPYLAPRPVVSGRAYRVLPVEGAAQPALEDFVGDTRFALDLDGEEYLVVGAGFLLPPVVRFHQKDCEGGKDVRVWTIRRDDDGGEFLATP